jgi:MFS family permease
LEIGLGRDQRNAIWWKETAMGRLACIIFLISCILIWPATLWAEQPGSQDGVHKDLLEKWKIGRSVIEGESGVISWKLSAFLTLQGFLFAALGIVISSYLEALHTQPDRKMRMHGMSINFGLLMCSVGLVSSLITFAALLATLDYTREVADWWETCKDQYKPQTWEFPQNIRPSPAARVLVICIPLMTLGSWIVAMLLLLSCSDHPPSMAFLKRIRRQKADGNQPELPPA